MAVISLQGVADRISGHIRYAARSLRHSPVFSCVIAGSLGVSVGLSAVVVAAARTMLSTAPAGIPEDAALSRVQERFVVAQTREVRFRDRFSFPEAREIEKTSPHAQIVAYTSTQIPDSNSTESGSFMTYVVGDYFNVLGVRPALGRLFAGGDGRAAEPVAVISYDWWKSRFGGMRDVIGRTLALGDARVTIVGVAPPSFRGLDLQPSDVWVPFGTAGPFAPRPDVTYDWRFRVIARISSADRQPTLANMQSSLRALNVAGDSKATAILAPITASLDPQRANGVRSILNRLSLAVGIILLLSITNVVNLVLVRLSLRRRDAAVRLALGATPATIAAHVVTELALLACFAAAIATCLALWTSAALQRLLVPGIVVYGHTRPGLAAAAVALLVTLAFLLAGGAIALVERRRDGQMDWLRISADSGFAKRSKARSAIVVLQVALSTALVAGCVLTVASLTTALRRGAGYEAEDVAFLSIQSNASRENPLGVGPSEIPIAASTLAMIPGVASVAMSATTPIESVLGSTIKLPGRDSVPRDPAVVTSLQVVSPGFLRTVGIRLIQGRDFVAGDTRGFGHVVLVSALMARRYWPGEDAIGKCLIVRASGSQCQTVVGVVGNVHNMKIVEGDAMTAYLPMPTHGDTARWTPHVVVVRAAPGRLSRILPTIRAALPQTHAGRWRIKPYLELLSPELNRWRLAAGLFSTLAVIGLVIAAIGTYGLVASMVTARTREIGVRRALGAQSVDVIRTACGEAALASLGGAVCGAGLALILGQLLRSLLFGVSATSLSAVLLPSVVVVAVAFVASAAPVWRALRISPTLALAAE